MAQMQSDQASRIKPEILAPAGDQASFLAALAAGADAIYLGLKNFSARMEAKNFSLTELSKLTDLTHAQQAKVYVAMNTLVRQSECTAIYRLLRRLVTQVHCDGLIVQDLALLDLARQAGFTGLLTLSTLANVTHPAALQQAVQMGANRVVLPRELSVDEIRLLDANCPQHLELETFIHGALCYCVSGRCYWSSYLGGRSGLRGRCTQPCRRMYNPGTEQNKNSSLRLFSCQDFSLDVLAKILLTLPHLVSWKIEGRKKGPHYVFHAVTAYRMLRDNPNDAQTKKAALALLDMALGRPSTHARFLPQKDNQIPTDPSGLTSSGQFLGVIRKDSQGQSVLRPRIALLPQDYLRIGVEDERWHAVHSVKQSIPKGSNYVLRLSGVKPPAGTPVFLIDRREPELLQILRQWQQKLETFKERPSQAVEDRPLLPKGKKAKSRPDIRVLSAIPTGKANRSGSKSWIGLWLSKRSADISRPVAQRVVWWLPPVLWPEEESVIQRQISNLWRDGCRHFVCNTLGQRAFFPPVLPADSDLIAGPFCNLANTLALAMVAKMGFAAAFVSPELPAEDILTLPSGSPLPLGFILEGYWPVGISRFGLLGLKPEQPFIGAKGEIFWSKRYGENIWLYPAWPLNFAEKKKELLSAGYTFFATLQENPPQSLPQTKRPGLFNWDGNLL